MLPPCRVRIWCLALLAGLLSLSAVPLAAQAAAPPSTDVTCPAGWTNDNPATCTVTGTAPGGFMRNVYGIDAAPGTISTSPSFSVSVSGQGIHSVSAYTVDLNSQTSAVATAPVKIDTAPPVVQPPTLSGCVVTWAGISDGFGSQLDPSAFSPVLSTDAGHTWDTPIVSTGAYSAANGTFVMSVPQGDCVSGAELRVRLTMYDNAGNRTTIGHPLGGTTLTVSTVNAPSTAVQCPSGWHVPPVTCTVTGTAPNGFKKNTYGIAQSYEEVGLNQIGLDAITTVHVTTGGDQVLKARTTDANGISGLTVSTPVRLDNEVPMANDTVTGPPLGSCVVSVDAIDDAMSGVDPAGFTARYTTDGGTTWHDLVDGAYDVVAGTYRASIPTPVCVPGATLGVAVGVTDKAGNVFVAGGDHGSPITIKGESPTGPKGPTDPGVPTGPGTTGGGVAGGGNGSVGLDGSLLDAATGDPDVLCASGRLRLVDVYPVGNTVQLLGVAPAGSAGKKVSVFFAGGAKAVGAATVKPDLTFTAAVKLPSKKLRSTKKAQYQVRLGSARSAAVALGRRLFVHSVGATAGKVTITGSVVKPLASRQPIVVRASSSCDGVARGVVIGKVMPRANGSFSLRVDLPAALANSRALYLGAELRVPMKAGSKQTTLVTSLSRGVALH